jgi:hypothetical protein
MSARERKPGLSPAIDCRARPDRSAIQPQSSPGPYPGTLEPSGPPSGGRTGPGHVRQPTAQPMRTGQRQPAFQPERPRTQTRGSPGQPRTLKASTRANSPGRWIEHVRQSKLGQPPTQSRVGPRQPQARRASIRATGQVLAAVGGPARKDLDSDNLAPAGKTRGPEPRRTTLAGPATLE